MPVIVGLMSEKSIICSLGLPSSYKLSNVYVSELPGIGYT